MGNITPQKIIIYVKFGRTFLCNNNILFKCGCLFGIITHARIMPDGVAEEEIPQEKKKKEVSCAAEGGNSAREGTMPQTLTYNLYGPRGGDLILSLCSIYTCIYTCVQMVFARNGSFSQRYKRRLSKYRQRSFFFGQKPEFE